MTEQSPVKPTLSKELKDLGLKIRGIVMGHNRFVTQKGEERITVDLAIPGCRQLISVPVEKPLPLHHVYECYIAPSLSKGNLYWNLV
jgi:hypothetical protein